LGKVPDHNLDGTSIQLQSYAAEDTHLICKSPVLSTLSSQQQALSPSA